MRRFEGEVSHRGRIIGLIVLAMAIPNLAIGDEETETFEGIFWHLSPPKSGGLPPFTTRELDFQDSTAKPVGAQMRLPLGERSLLLKSNFLDRYLGTDSFTRHVTRRPIYALSGSTPLLHDLLKADAEFVFNGLDSKKAALLGREHAQQMRFALNGQWRGYRYGAEYRAADKGVMLFRGGEAGRSEETAHLWGESNFGPLRVRAALSQLWENLNESQTTPRTTQSSSLSLNYKKGDWESLLASAYSFRDDRFQSGADADVFAHELRLTWQPVREVKLMPHARFAEERSRLTGVDRTTPSTGLTLTYNAAHNVVTVFSHASYSWNQTTDKLTKLRDLQTTTRLVWNFGKGLEARKSLSFEVAYKRHLDLLVRGNSTDGWSTRVTFTVVKF